MTRRRLRVDELPRNATLRDYLAAHRADVEDQAAEQSRTKRREADRRYRRRRNQQRKEGHTA
ncbi:hypothetical protein [Mycolicibacterium elephantis]|uniref:hypothetical protein n=1 Tax=Mycolicibacterium elephantis TaxID=81858 RepID=UPI000FE25D12|nr:hypothetical protein [Mycolicibacterium elephantis]MCV7221610.1 hypothetical protein [Mycolicibacterium elephantis]